MIDPIDLNVVKQFRQREQINVGWIAETWLQIVEIFNEVGEEYVSHDDVRDILTLHNKLLGDYVKICQVARLTTVIEVTSWPAGVQADGRYDRFEGENLRDRLIWELARCNGII